MKRLVLLAPLTVAMIPATQVVGATTLTSSPSKDNTMFEEGALSNGSGQYVYAGNTDDGNLRRGAIAFNLTQVPDGATITSATLTLNLSRTSRDGNADTVGLHRFLANWGEGTSNSTGQDGGGGGASATTGDVTWTRAFYNTVPWATPGGVFSPTVSASRSVQALGLYNFTSAQLLADVNAWLDNPTSNFGWALLGNEASTESAERFDSREHTNAAVRPRLTLVYDVVAAGSTWNVNGGGSWGNAANWTGGVPNGAGAEARFLDRLTAANAPAIVTLDGTRTVGRLTFDNINSYVIAAGAGDGELVLNNNAQSASLDVVRGTHTIRTPLRIAGNTTAAIASRLNANGGIVVEAARTLTKSGAGTLDVGQSPGVGVHLAAGSRLVVNGGTVSTANVRGGVLTIQDARVNIKPDGTSAGVSTVTELFLQGAGTLDLNDNDLVVRATATTQQAVLDAIVERVRAARNSAPTGRWLGPGLTSSAAATNPLTTLAAVINPGIAAFSGEAVGANDVLIKYTYNGDANLDGRVNSDDYFRIDSGFLAQPANATLAQGDFNYDGRINSDDYFLIDSAFLGQGAPLATAGSGDSSLRFAATPPAVPEPRVAIAFIGAAAFALVRRRRRLRA